MRRSPAVLVALFLLALVCALAICVGLVVYGTREPAAGDAALVPEQAPRLPAPTASPLTPRLKPQTFRPTSATAKLQVLDYDHFTVGYDNAARSPAWVTYDLDGPVRYPGPEAKRPAKFRMEDRTSARVRHEEYSNSGYDRGHMCPSAAEFSRFGEPGEDETFVMSNVIPQVHSLNAGVWEDLEVAIAGRRSSGGWAESLGHLTVINGPVYGSASAFQHMPSGAPVPTACYSIVLDYVETTGTYRALAFEMPDQDGVSGPPTKYLVSIKQVENDTGLDMFAGVDPEVRAEVEEVRAAALW